MRISLSAGVRAPHAARYSEALMTIFSTHPTVRCILAFKSLVEMRALCEQRCAGKLDDAPLSRAGHRKVAGPP